MPQPRNPDTSPKPSKTPQVLTAKLIGSAVCPEGAAQLILWDSKISGLGCRISPLQKKTIVFQSRVKGGRERRISLGAFDPTRQFSEYRALALDHHKMMSTGVDPVEEKQRLKDEKEKQVIKDLAFTTTLRQVMEHYLLNKKTSHGKPLRPVSQRDMRRHVEKSLSDWADLPIASITRNNCAARFNELTLVSPGQASQCMVNLRALINYAREMYSDDDGNYRIHATNPVARMVKLVHGLNKLKPKTGRIPLDKIGAVWHMLQQRKLNARTVDDKTACDWVSFIILTGTRRTESGSLLWSNVDLEAATFSLSGDTVKNHNQITLPCSAPLLAMLKARKEQPEVDEKVIRRRRHNAEREDNIQYVFSSWSGLGYIGNAQKTMAAVSEVAGVKVTIHDLRRTYDDLAQAVNVGEDVRRQLLNHLASDVHGKHYSNNPDPSVLKPAVDAIADYILAQAKIIADKAEQAEAGDTSK